MGALESQGALACASPAGVAARSDLVISLVSDRAQTDDVVFGNDGILGTIEPGAIFAIGSTLGPTPVRKIEESLRAPGAHVLDMPISGGLIAAREGTLSLMVGGDASVVERAAPVLRMFARTITLAGAVGAGQ